MDLRYLRKIQETNLVNKVKNMVGLTKDNILDSLYTRCQKRSLRTCEVVDGLLKDLDIQINTSERDELIELIRPYKQTGKNLENTINSVYEKLNVTKNFNNNGSLFFNIELGKGRFDIKTYNQENGITAEKLNQINSSLNTKWQTAYFCECVLPDVFIKLSTE